MTTSKSKIIFINPMGVLTNDEFYKGNEQAFNDSSLSDSLVRLLKNVVHDYNVKIVFVETWMKDKHVLLNSLQRAGFHDIEKYFHSIIKYPVGCLQSKSDFIYETLLGNNSEAIILDNNTQMKNYNGDHRNKGIFTNIALGLTASDLLELRKQIEA